MRDLWFEWYENALDNGEDTSYDSFQDHLFDTADRALGDD